MSPHQWPGDLADASNQPSSTNTIIVAVTDNSVPPFHATNSFVVMVIGSGRPLLTAPSTQMIYAGQTLVVTNYATNALFPHRFLHVCTAPSGGDQLGCVGSAHRRRFDLGDHDHTKARNLYIGIMATDNAPPNFSATNRFLIVISKPPPPSLTASASPKDLCGPDPGSFRFSHQ